MNYNVFPLFSRDHKDIPYWRTEDEHPIFAKDHKDVPDWMKVHHQWEPAFDVNKLPKHQLKVKMCCLKCEQIVVERIREVRGVFDVRAERREKKVVVVAMPGGLDEHEVLKKARKVHRKARFVELDDKEKAKPKVDNKPKQDGHGPDKEAGGEGQGKKKLMQSGPALGVPGVAPLVPWGQQFWPVQSSAPRFFYPPHQIQPFPGPHGQYVYFL